jgi:hypothetical protein
MIRIDGIDEFINKNISFGHKIDQENQQMKSKTLAKHGAKHIKKHQNTSSALIRRTSL